MRRLDGVETFDFDLASGEAVLGVRPGTVLHEDQVRAGVTGAGLVLESLTAPAGGAPGVCVVSGRPLPTDGQTVEIEHAGRKVRLCCEKCIAEFRADPEKFLAKLP